MDEYIKAAKGASRAELDRMLASVFKALDELRRQEKVRNANRRIRRVGRPALRAGAMLRPRMVNVGIFGRATR